MHGLRESDSPIVPAKLPNEADKTVEEEVEERGLTKGNSSKQNISRTQGRISMQHELERVRQAAKKNKELRLNALYHHVYNINTLREAYYSIRKYAAKGVDGVTWSDYGKNLEENLKSLSMRLKNGAYRAKPSLRVYVPKTDGTKRPIGIMALEDKIVQRATTEVLNKIYESDFCGFSYGFRPGKGPHNALDALCVGIEKKKINWILDADICSYFDSINHEWLIRFLEHRVSDQRIIRLIKKWIKAGILENNKITQSEVGTCQGGGISPLLANIYLHYVFDLWVHKWRERKAHGEVIVIRFADDIIMGFQYKSDAELFLKHLALRFQKFNLKLHSTKTRLVEFGRYAEERRRKRGKGKPETFTFLGFTHICGKTRQGEYKIMRHTKAKKLRLKLKEIKIQLRKRLHLPVRETAKWLQLVYRGHINYFAVPGNIMALQQFRFRLGWIWCRSLRRRSQKHRLTWERMKKLMNQWLPVPRILHPHPSERFARQYLR